MADENFLTETEFVARLKELEKDAVATEAKIVALKEEKESLLLDPNPNPNPKPNPDPNQVQRSGDGRQLHLQMCSVFEKRGFKEGFDWLSKHIK